MNRNFLHKKQPAPGRFGRKAGRPRMMAAHQAGTHAAIVTAWAGYRLICYASAGPELWPVQRAPEICQKV